MIVVESKGRRIRVEARVDTEHSALRENLANAIDALTRIPDKITSLLGRADVCTRHRSTLDAVCPGQVLGVVVIGESTPMLTSIARC